MVVLVLAILLSLSAQAAVMPADPVARVALLQLEQGDVVRGRRTAARLEKQDPQLATLYRLEWLASEIRLKAGKLEPESSAKLKWKPSSEIWSDEWESYLSNRHERKVKELLQPTAGEQQVIASLMKPYLGSEKALRPELDETLLTYVFNEYVAGQDISLALPKNPRGCQWKAASSLVTGNYPGDLATCASCEGKFCTRLAIQMADDATEKGQYPKALGLYLKATRSLSTIPDSIQYRVAALQILTGQRLEKVLRTSIVLLEKDSTVLKPAQKSAVEGYICEHMADMSAGGLKNLLREVFTDRAWLRQARSWISTCPVNDSAKIAQLRKLSGLNEMERESLGLAWEVRQSKERSRQVRSQRERQELASADKGGLAAHATELKGVLSVPVLLPFAPVAMEPSSYRVGRMFSQVVSESSL